VYTKQNEIKSEKTHDNLQQIDKNTSV